MANDTKADPAGNSSLWRILWRVNFGGHWQSPPPPPFLILPHVSNKAQDRKEEKEKNKHESYTINSFCVSAFWELTCSRFLLLMFLRMSLIRQVHLPHIQLYHYPWLITFAPPSSFNWHKPMYLLASLCACVAFAVLSGPSKPSIDCSPSSVSNHSFKFNLP